MALTKVKASNITLTTPSASSNDTSPATTEYVTTALANLADSAPSTLNTLNELAAALGDDANFSTTVTNSIATKAPLASPTFTGNINGGDGVELRLGNSQDILFKHHSGGYGHLENKNGTFYIDSETFDIRTDIDNASLAIGIDAAQRVGINQTPSGTNFTLQVTGRVTDGTDGRAAYFKGYGTQTSIGSTGPTVVVQNANTTTNNYAKLSFESSGGGETVSINSHNIDHTNHYGDMAFNTRGSGGYSEKMRIKSNGEVEISEDNLYLTGSNDRRIKLSDSGIAGISDSNNTVHIRGDNDFLKLMAAGNGGLIYEENGTEHLKIASGGQLYTNSGFGSSGKAYSVRAWANINQSTDAIRGSGNVSSVTDNGNAQYTINFSTAMPDTNYAMFGTASNENNGVAIDGSPPTTYTTSAVKVRIFDASNAYQELTNGILNIQVVR